MKLNKIERKTLQFLDSYRSHTPTFGEVMAKSWPALLPFLGLIAFGLAIAGGMLSLGGDDISGAGWWVVGLGCGAAIRDIKRLWLVARVWRIYLEITNWQRVSELLAGDEGRVDEEEGWVD